MIGRMESNLVTPSGYSIAMLEHGPFPWATSEGSHILT
jgi:hypothetical protein